MSLLKSVYSFDCETYRIRSGLAAPKGVCLSYDKDGTAEGTGVVLIDEGVKLFRKWINDPDIILVGHVVTYDLCIMAAEDETLLPLIFQALEENRIRCTKVREKILHNIVGELKYEWDEESESWKSSSYKLDRIVWNRYKKYLPKEDTWRLRYCELAGVPIEQWPPDAIKYAIDDAVYARRVYFSQEEDIKEVCKKFDIKDGELPGENHFTRKAFVFGTMRSWGVRTDPEAVVDLRKEIKEQYELWSTKGQELKLIKPTDRTGKRVRNMKAIKQRVTEVYTSFALEVPPTEKGGVSTDRETMSFGKYPELPRQVIKFGKDKDGKDLEHSCVDFPMFVVSQVVKYQKFLTTYVPIIERGTKYPITADWNEMVETGRSSCSKPNLQNVGRDGSVRRCYVPRTGHVFTFCDYSTLEMRTLAQTCIDLFGYSFIADSIKAGRDLHIDLATEWLGLSYDEALARYEAGDKVIANARQFAKCFHPDTEILTPKGWKKIADLQLHDDVAAAIPENGAIRIEWQKPLALQRQHADELVHLKNEGIDLRVTRDHRMLGYRRSEKPFVTIPEEMNKAHGWYNTGTAPGGSWNPNEELLRLAVATQADGSYSRDQIVLAFSKKRKIERMRSMLKNMPHHERLRTQGLTSFVIYGPGDKPGRKTPGGPAIEIKELLTDKKFDARWLNLSSRGRQIVLDEAQFWDATKGGTRTKAYVYVSMIKSNCEILQIIATLEGRKTRLVQDKSSKMWRLTIRKTDRSRGGAIETTIIPHGGEVVCLSVQSSFVVVRDGGVPVVTGQCGNYGLAGGMGPDTFVDYARGSGIFITVEQARMISQAFRLKWKEMTDYFNYCSNMLSGDEVEYAIHPRTKMIRGKVRYTAFANNGFQHPAAIGTGEALYQSVKETLIVKESPLYGCRVWLFAHDEEGMEIPYDIIGPKRAHEAAMRLKQVMIDEMKKIVPNVPIEAEPVMMRRWLKNVKAVYVDGLMVPCRAEGKKSVPDFGEPVSVQAAA